MHLRNSRSLQLAVFVLLFCFSSWAQSGSASSAQQNQSTIPPQPPVNSVPPPAPVPATAPPDATSGTSSQPSPGPAQPSTPTKTQPQPANTTSQPAAPTQNQQQAAPVQTQSQPSSAPTQTAPQQAPPSTPLGQQEPQALPPQPLPSTPSGNQTQGGSQPAEGNAQAPTSGQTPDGQQGEQGTPAAQDQGQAPENEGGGFVFKAQVEEVSLHATVLDDKQRLVTNLDKSAFTVFENNQPQQITSFRHEDVPVAMAIVIDNSGSMREKRDKVNKAAINLVKSSNPRDQVFVVNFNDEYYLDQDFTSDINKLQQALERVESRGGTALYDAIVASADHLKKNAKLDKKVLFVVTDGEDNASREVLEQAIRRLQAENGPTVYAIGLLGDERQRRARRALQEIALRTGGVAFLPRTLDEVDEISRTVAHDIRNQYTIGYRPTTPKSAGGYRTIHVDAKARGYGKLTVRTRSGYYAGQERAAGGSQ